jgi:hypothetical protein
MHDSPYRPHNLYRRRLDKEKTIAEEEIQARMKWEMPVLSTNHKCAVSLDFPVLNCVPTSICAQVCYAAQGRQYYRKSIVKSLAVARLIDLDPERVARKMVDEAADHTIRIAGSGDSLPHHKSLFDEVSRLGGSTWGFTRRIDTHQAIPSFMFSIDASSPSPVMEYVRDQVPVARRAYLRRPEDLPSPIEVAVTFPVHGHLTPYTKVTPVHETDCPAGRKRVEGCLGCRRCW